MLPKNESHCRHCLLECSNVLAANERVQKRKKVVDVIVVDHVVVDLQRAKGRGMDKVRGTVKEDVVAINAVMMDVATSEVESLGKGGGDSDVVISVADAIAGMTPIRPKSWQNEK